MRSVPLPFLSQITPLWTRVREPGPVSPVKVDSPLPFPWTQRDEIYIFIVKPDISLYDLCWNDRIKHFVFCLFIRGSKMNRKHLISPRSHLDEIKSSNRKRADLYQLLFCIHLSDMVHLQYYNCRYKHQTDGNNDHEKYYRFPKVLRCIQQGFCAPISISYYQPRVLSICKQT